MSVTVVPLTTKIRNDFRPASGARSDTAVQARSRVVRAVRFLSGERSATFVKERSMAKAETSWRFWGLYVHVCKLDTLREAYALAKKNDGAPGSDGMTFAAIEAQGSHNP